MSEENKEIETNKEKKHSKCRIFASCFCVLLLFISIFCCSCTNEKHNVFVKGPDMDYFHNGPAVLLDDGNVLVIGGNTKHAEIYDYKKNKFELSGEMNFKRNYGAAVSLLKNGNVLITGGASLADITSKSFFSIPEHSELYNINTKKFLLNSKMRIPRIAHDSLLADNGNVLIFGGWNRAKKQVLEIEEYDIKNNKFNIIGKLPSNIISYYGTVKIKNNKYIIAGADSTQKGKSNAYKIWIFDYNKKSIYEFKPSIDNNADSQIYIKNRNFPEHIHSDMDKNFVVVVYNNKDKIQNISLIFSNKFYDTLIKLDDSEVLSIGGLIMDGWGGKITNTIEIFKFAPLNINTYTSNLSYKRCKHNSIKLKNNKILILGGYNKTSPYEYKKSSQVLSVELLDE